MKGTANLYDLAYVGRHWTAWAQNQLGKLETTQCYNINFFFSLEEEDGKEYVKSCIRLENGKEIPFPRYLSLKQAINYYRHILMQNVGVEKTGWVKQSDEGFN